MTKDELKQILVEVEPEDLIEAIIAVFGKIDATELAYSIIEEAK